MVVHDFSGHPFQVQLARHLAHRGWATTHLHCPSFQTPKGNVETGEDTSNFQSSGVALRKQFSKYSWPRRFLQEFEYGLRLSREVRRLRPRVVLSANTPLIAAFVFQMAMKLSRIPVVFWQQDVYSAALSGHVSERAGFVGRVMSAVFYRMEKWSVRSSARVVVISEDFLGKLADWRIPSDRIDVVENWAPLDELPPQARPNEWSQAHGITDDQVVFLYAGTLGLKHQPSLLLDLARAFADRPDVRVIVASEGLGASWLEEQSSGESCLELIPFQPYEQLANMLGSASVLLVLLEPHAGGYSVPSKVLTYHCAGRPLLGAMPAENLASRNITATGSGVVVTPGDSAALVAAAERLVADPELRAAMGDKARAYAEYTFDIIRITDIFERILDQATGASPRTG